ncbi:MAG: insulinase family protein [Gemmatimonadales bacterium]|nr:insulinase family protein [Gemmatimonadales bacterium]NIN12432.1 insulinase family protein [Gemmatimonadales bacterium]NIN50808.1 insulinase family protein [Gemmatimonadales bacterium]NIP08272.1 insulinase family protein [Gemmatimonadales bacterium]NIR00796.1 insulinase family protein [Gemmatimonadales bacterium]
MLRVAIPVALAVTCTAVSLSAQQRIEFDRYTLPNGLRVILSQDHSTPIVTVSVWYNVGSADELLGRSGFAHLFEHMMFQGSEHVQKREHTNTIQRAGGTVNGTTNEDRTNYFETLPANRLNVGLWLEADRMRSLAVTTENFENQRDVVKEERRLRLDNQPYTPAIIEGTTLLFDSTTCFPYSHSVIGSMDDLDAAQVEDVQAFFDLYYAPNNATLTVVGDFEPADAKRLIDQYYGDIPRGRDAPRPECQVTYGQGAGERVWEDKLATLPGVIIAYLAPPHAHPDTRALQLLSTILGAGESSRLNRALVRDAKTAVVSVVQMSSRRGPGLFAAIAIANQGFTTDTIKAQLQEQVAKVLAEGVTEQELTKAKNSFRAQDVFGRQTTFAIAEELQHFAHFHESLDEIHTDLDGYMQVTAADIQRVAEKYLVPENSLTIIIVPATAAGAGGTY